MEMDNVFWTLGRKVYPLYPEFIAAVTAYQQDIAPDRSGWNPDQKIAETPIQITYEARWKNEDDMLHLVIGTPGHGVTMGEILFTLNNESYNFFHGADTCFFEGLTWVSGNTYRLMVGS